jgi:hypothetical protein
LSDGKIYKKNSLYFSDDDLLRVVGGVVAFFEDEEIAFYKDKSTICKNGNISRIWAKMIFHETQKDQSGTSYKSKKILFAFDCNGKESTLISGFDFSEPMGCGKVIGSYALQKIG